MCVCVSLASQTLYQTLGSGLRDYVCVCVYVGGGGGGGGVTNTLGMCVILV